MAQDLELLSEVPRRYGKPPRIDRLVGDAVVVQDQWLRLNRPDNRTQRGTKPHEFIRSFADQAYGDSAIYLTRHAFKEDKRTMLGGERLCSQPTLQSTR